MDGIQKLLIVVIVTLTSLLVIVGVQVFLIMMGLKRTLRKLNTILEDSIMGGGLIRPEKLTGILEFFKRTKKMEKRGGGNDSEFPLN